jgi:hypothetical protein
VSNAKCIKIKKFEVILSINRNIKIKTLNNFKILRNFDIATEAYERFIWIEMVFVGDTQAKRKTKKERERRENSELI